MSRTILEDARCEIVDMVIKANIPGLVPNHHAGLYNERLLEAHYERLRDNAKFKSLGGYQGFSWEQSWGVNCDLSVDWETVTRVIAGKKVKLSEPRCKVSWSSTGRDPMAARAAIMLYSAVTDLAILIETHFRDREVESGEEAFERLEKERKKKDKKSA